MSGAPAGDHSDDRAVDVDFFGGRARFPAGPYILASMPKYPVHDFCRAEEA